MSPSIMIIMIMLGCLTSEPPSSLLIEPLGVRHPMQWALFSL